MYILMSVSLSTRMLDSTCVEIRGQPRSPSSSSALLDTGCLCSPLHLRAGWLPIFRRFSCQCPILQLECSRRQTSAAFCLGLGFAFSSPHLCSSHLPTERSPWFLCLCLGFEFRSSRLRSSRLPTEQSPWSLTFLGTQFWDLLGMGFSELPGYRHTQILYLKDAIFTNSTA